MTLCFKNKFKWFIAIIHWIRSGWISSVISICRRFTKWKSSSFEKTEGNHKTSCGKGLKLRCQVLNNYIADLSLDSVKNPAMNCSHHIPEMARIFNAHPNDLFAYEQDGLWRENPSGTTQWTNRRGCRCSY